MADIDYGKILKRSFEITKKYKWLWIYGLVLAAFGGGGSGGGGGGGSNGGSIRNIPKELPEDLPEKTSQVLGETTSLLREWISHVPVSTWILIGIGIFLVILFWIIFSLVVRAWAKGGLIAGLAEAHKDKEVTLMSSSPKGIAAIKHLIIYALLSTGIALLILAVVVVVVGSGYVLFSLLPPLQTIWLIISLVTGVLTFIIAFVVLSMITIYAERLIVLKGYTPWRAWKKGLTLSRRSFLSTILMGLINTAIGCTIGCIVLIALIAILGIPAIILIIPIIKGGSQTLILGSLGGFVILLLMFVYVNYLIRALLAVFTYSNWNLFFEQIVQEEET